MTEKRDETETKLPPESSDSSEVESLVGLEKVLTHFVESFEASAQRWEQLVYPFVRSFGDSTKRWERMIYPSIFVFGIMGVSGFWLIYSLTSDVHELAVNVDPKMERNLALMAENMSQLSAKLDTLPPLLIRISEMNESMKAMTVNTGFMSRDMGVMNQNIGRPLSFMNSFSPW